MKAWLSKVLESSRGAVRSLLETAGGRAALGTLALLVFLTIAGLLVLWPYGEGPGFAPSVSADTERAEVLSVSSEGCDLEAARAAGGWPCVWRAGPTPTPVRG